MSFGSSIYGGRGTSTGSNQGQQLMGSPGFKEKIPSGYRKGTLQQFTPEQMELFQQLFGNLGPDSFLSQIAGGDEEAFNQLEAPALRQFSGEIGNLASRFTGFGGKGSFGARHSSGFQNAAGAQASNFAQDLQANRLNLRSQALKDLMNMSNQLLNQRPQQNYLVKKQQNPWYNIAGQLTGALPGAIAGYAGGGSEGAAQGANGGFSLLPGIGGMF